MSERDGAGDLAAGIRGAAGMAVVGSSVAVSVLLVDGPLLTGQGWRYTLASAVLVLIARVRGVVLVRPRGCEWLWTAGVALTGLALFNVAIVQGVARAEPAVIAVAVAGAPVVIALLGPVLEARVPHGQVLVAAVVVTLGSVLVVGVGRTDAWGVAWAALALACEAAFTLLAVPVLPRLSPWGVSVHATWLAAVMLLVVGAVLEGPAAVLRIDPVEAAALAYLAIATTAIAFVLWYGAVRVLGSARAALLCGVAPVSAALVGAVTTGVVPRVGVWLGIAVIALGLARGMRPDALGRCAAPAARRAPS